MWLNILVVLAFGIILVLSVIAAYYVVRLYRFRKEQKKIAFAQEEKLQAQQIKTGKSISVIAHAILEEQMSICEGAIRLSVLLEGMRLKSEEKSEFIVFYKLAESIAHIPILEEWKKLPRNDKLKYEQELQEKEDRYRDFILDASQKLLNRFV